MSQLYEYVEYSYPNYLRVFANPNIYVQLRVCFDELFF